MTAAGKPPTGAEAESPVTLEGAEKPPPAHVDDKLGPATVEPIEADPKVLARQRGRGRDAASPGEIPKAGWRDVLLRTKDAIGDDYIGVVAAGIAFYALLAILPAMVALISLWGLLFDPAQIGAQIEQITGALPAEAAEIIRSQARDVASNAQEEVTAFAAILGLAVAVFSAAKGVKALMNGLNIVYGEREKRNFLQVNLVAVGLTFVLILGLLVSLGSVVVLPVAMEFIGFVSPGEAFMALLRWPVMLALAMLGLAVLYRFAPSREKPQWRWVSWGAVVATTLWILASILFSIYVRNFSSYNETYGALGAVVILLMWLWISAFILLLGAELNSEMEHQTTRDSTDGRSRPMGQRGAHVADTLGEKP